MSPKASRLPLADMHQRELERHGFLQKGPSYSAMGSTTRPGVYVAGSATGPETIDDSIAQGQAAAMAAIAGQRMLTEALAG